MMPAANDIEAQRAAYRERMEALERVRARELASMTEERAWAIIKSLVAVDVPRQQPENWSGLVEQQAIFARWRKTLMEKSARAKK